MIVNAKKSEFKHKSNLNFYFKWLNNLQAVFMELLTKLFQIKQLYYLNFININFIPSTYKSRFSEDFSRRVREYVYIPVTIERHESAVIIN